MCIYVIDIYLFIYLRNCLIRVIWFLVFYIQSLEKILILTFVSIF